MTNNDHREPPPDPLAELQEQRERHGKRHDYFAAACDPDHCAEARWLALCDRLAAAATRHGSLHRVCNVAILDLRRQLEETQGLAGRMAEAEPESDPPEHYRYSSQVPEALRRVELGIKTIEQGVEKHGTTMPWDYRVPLDGLTWAAGVLSLGQGLLQRAIAAERQRYKAAAALAKFGQHPPACPAWRTVFWKPPLECDCGLAAALAAQTATEGEPA